MNFSVVIIKSPLISMAFDVISIGSAILDIFVKSSELGVLKTTKSFTGKLTTAPYGAKCDVEELLLASGGGATNTGTGFSRLGLKASVLARTGWDFGGKLIRSELKKEGVDDSLLIQREKEETDTSIILVAPDGGGTIFVYRGGTKLGEEIIDYNKLEARWFCISSLEGNLDLLSKLIQYAQKQNIRISLNPGRKEIEQKEALLPLLQEVDVLIINQEEALRLGEGMAFGLSGGIVVVTRGEKGACLYDQKDRLLVAAGYQVEMADATGAGDGFTSGFVAGLIKGWNLQKALKLGISNGASVVEKIGAKAGLINENNIQNWLKKDLDIAWN